MDYLVHYGSRDGDPRDGTQKLFQTGDAEEHQDIVEALRKGQKVRWNNTTKAELSTLPEVPKLLNSDTCLLD